MRLNSSLNHANELYSFSKSDVIEYLNSKDLSFVSSLVEQYEVGYIDEYCLTLTKSGYVLEVGVVGQFGFETYRTIWKK